VVRVPPATSSSSRTSPTCRSVTTSTPSSSAANSVARRGSSLMKEALVPSVRADLLDGFQPQVEAFAVEGDQTPPAFGVG
jgi:hypothetical protein